MKFILATAVTLLIGAILGYSIWAFIAKGNAWLLTLSSLGFLYLFGKVGCASH